MAGFSVEGKENAQTGRQTCFLLQNLGKQLGLCNIKYMVTYNNVNGKRTENEQ